MYVVGRGSGLPIAQAARVRTTPIAVPMVRTRLALMDVSRKEPREVAPCRAGRRQVRGRGSVELTLRDKN
jgi:hypothetical protein